MKTMQKIINQLQAILARIQSTTKQDIIRHLRQIRAFDICALVVMISSPLYGAFGIPENIKTGPQAEYLLLLFLAGFVSILLMAIATKWDSDYAPKGLLHKERQTD